jgi:hypothetical protein
MELSSHGVVNRHLNRARSQRWFIGVVFYAASGRHAILERMAMVLAALGVLAPVFDAHTGGPLVVVAVHSGC